MVKMRPTPKDRWDKADVVLKAATALLVAGLGFFITQKLNAQQAALRTEAEVRKLAEERFQLMMQLSTRAQESEQALRKDLFAKYVHAFVDAQERDAPTEPARRLALLRSMMLKLELLADNFHEAINLRPYFVYLSDQVDRLEGDAALNGQVPGFREQLQLLAKNVVKRQLQAIRKTENVLTLHIDLSKCCEEPMLLTGTSDADVDAPTAGPAEVVPDFEVPGLSETTTPLRLGDSTWACEVSVVREGNGENALGVELFMEEVGKSRQFEGRIFRLSRFDFPLVDNMQLSADHRCAVVLSSYDPRAQPPSATIEVVVFEEYQQHSAKILKAMAKLGATGAPP